MKTPLKIGDKTFKAEATAATPVYYRQAFNKDIFIDLGKNAQLAEEGKEDEIDQNIYARIAYIITGEHKKKDFIKFLEQFKSYDIFVASQDIINIWEGNTETIEEEKEEKGKNRKAAED